jgi:histone H3/H4
MVEKAKSNNTLIKKNNLGALLKNNGIGRVGEGVLDLIEEKVVGIVEKLGRVLEQEMIVSGRRGIDKELVKRVLERKEEEMDFL